LSARLDGEDDPAERGAVDRHIASCSGCRRFQDDAAWVTRLTRTSVAEPGPDLVDRVLATAPRSRRGRFAAIARVLIGFVAAGQLALAGVGLLATQEMAHTAHPATLSGATMTHMSHEAAAWNLAIGVGFLWVALRSSRTAGLVPVLSAFVALLTMLSAVDLVAGRVDTLRLLSHLLVVLGLGLVLLLDRMRAGGGGSSPADRYRRGGVRGGMGPHVAETAADDDHPGLRPTARHRAA
jgi:predicted anti-sigma-YlaC factor YlaD